MADRKPTGKSKIARDAKAGVASPVLAAAALPADAVATPVLPAEIVKKTAPSAAALKPAQPVKAPKPVLPAQAPEAPVIPAVAEAPVVVTPVAAPIAAQPVVEQASKTEAVSNPIKSGASTMTETINNTVAKAQEATQQAAQQAGEQFRGAFDQANERGKVAMEKGSRIVEEMADLTRGNLEAMVASQKTAAKYVESLTQGAADYSRRSFEEASTAFRTFAEAKSPTDIFRLQSDFARSAFDAMVAESARVSETVVKMSGDVVEPITSRYAVAAERLKAVAA